jgi:hypothetical protein
LGDDLRVNFYQVCHHVSHPVIPAKKRVKKSNRHSGFAATQRPGMTEIGFLHTLEGRNAGLPWIPAFAGMTTRRR